MRAKPGLQKILIVWTAAYVLALNAIIGSFAGAMAYAAPAAALGSICHSSEGEPQPPQRTTDCSHCVLCQAPSGGALLPVVAAVLEPVGTDNRRISLQSDAGSERPFTSAQARAPPFRI
jgi:hypothetical protein